MYCQAIKCEYKLKSQMQSLWKIYLKLIYCVSFINSTGGSVHHNKSQSKKRKIGGLPEERSIKESQANSYTVDLKSNQSTLGQEYG